MSGRQVLDGSEGFQFNFSRKGHWKRTWRSWFDFLFVFDAELAGRGFLAATSDHIFERWWNFFARECSAELPPPPMSKGVIGLELKFPTKPPPTQTSIKQQKSTPNQVSYCFMNFSFLLSPLCSWMKQIGQSESARPSGAVSCIVRMYKSLGSIMPCRGNHISCAHWTRL